VIFAKRPEGKPTVNCFKIEEVDPPKLQGKGVLCKTTYLSVDPYMRGRMDAKPPAYISAWELGKVPEGGGVGVVIESNVDKFQKGDLVYSFTYPFQEIAFLNEEQLKEASKLDKKLKNPSYALSILGMPGMTAYFGTTDILHPKKGETLVVTAAAGAVGSMVGQISKILGARVVGIAGDNNKLKKIKEWGFDETINYKEAGDKLKDEIAKLCPKKVDCFYDNVGGPVMDAVMDNMGIHGRVCICGAISQYSGENQVGPRMNTIILQMSLTVKGFIVMRDYGDRYSEGMKKMQEWMNEGKIKIEETKVDGIDKLPQAFVDLFEGKNVGKMVVNVSQFQSAQ